MLKTIKNTFLSIVFGCLVLSACSLNLFKQNPARENDRSAIMDDPLDNISQSVDLNDYNVEFLNQGQICYFKYTPDENGYYVIEATSSNSYATKIQVISAAFNTIVATNSSSNESNKVYFYAQQSLPIYFQCRYSQIWQSGYITSQIRKQFLTMFGINYGYLNINTIGDMTTPGNLFGNIFECRPYSNYTATQAIQNDERGIPKINSEMSFFAGHGDPGKLYFKNMTEFTSSNTTSLNRVRIAVLASCYSAATDSTYNVSIAEHFVNNGAKSALGFYEAINDATASDFTDELFGRLYIGESVASAASYAALSAANYQSDPIYNYEIFGISTLYITYTTMTNTMWSVRKNSMSNSEILDYVDSLFGSWTLFKMRCGLSRYYETIDGHCTSNFIDTKTDNGVDFEIIRENIEEYSSILPAFTKYKDDCIPRETNDSGYDLDNVTDDIVYTIIDNKMTPVYISYNTYRNKGLYSVIEIDCINLNNGARINYENIRKPKK